jgi:hypothetical protein
MEDILHRLSDEVRKLEWTHETRDEVVEGRKRLSAGGDVLPA